MVHIVYPYRTPIDSNFGWELKLSLRSLEQNFKEDFDVTVIGDIPDWIDKNTVNCVPFDNNHINCQRQSKINQKILLGSNLYEEMLVFNDDIYLMKPCTLEDFKIPRKIGKLHFKERTFKNKNSFLAQLQNGYFILKDLGKQYDINFCSHTPHFYEREKIREIQKYIDLAPISPLSVVFENIYHNFFGQKGKLVQDRYGCWHLDCEKYRGQLIFNHDENGVIKNPWIKEFLEKQFPYKSKFEK